MLAHHPIPQVANACTYEKSVHGPHWKHEVTNVNSQEIEGSEYDGLHIYDTSTIGKLINEANGGV
jgi:hypothetical protein